MVLSPQAQRAWKTATAIITAGSGFHLVFQVDYGDHDHVFTGVQKWYRKKMDDILIGDIDVRRDANRSSTRTGISSSTSTSGASDGNGNASNTNDASKR